MKQVIREFLAKLNTEEQAFIEEMRLDEVGVGMLTAIKEFDFYYYNLLRNEYIEETDLHFHIMRLGLPKLITGVLSGISQFKYPIFNFKSKKSLILGALDMMSALGFIEQGRRFSHAAFAGECEIRRFNERQYDVIMPDLIVDFEEHEASVENHYRRIYREQMDTAIHETFGKRGVIERISKLLTDNVYVFKDHFIGYNAHPDVDDFFFGMANMEIKNHSGYDTFTANVQFGGVSMQKYMLSITYFLSLALKHERFAEALVKKSPYIELRDVLTITCDKAEFESNLIAALNMWGPSFDGYTPLTKKEAETIINTLSVKRKTLSVLTSTMAPLPYLIEFSDSVWVKSIAAIQINPVDFLLNSLRHYFPEDYNINQQMREKSMQRALRQILSDHLEGLIFVDNVRIRHKGKILTDLDFTAIDEANGSIIFFQLKHQDAYGGDIRRRSNRAEKLRNEAGLWLNSMRKWVKETPSKNINSALRLKADFTLQNIHYVVLTRHFAHFLSGLDLTDASYATWTQFYDAFNRLHAEGRPKTLSSLFDILNNYMSHKTIKNIELGHLDSYHLRNVSYRIRPSAAG